MFQKYGIGIFVRGDVFYGMKTRRSRHTYIYTLYFNSNYQSSSIELIPSRKKPTECSS